uniref:OprD family outer membrane porin n=1 Tax=Pseudomonas sp. MWU13-2105 TaxID=2935074 RepID=UPI0020108336
SSPGLANTGLLPVKGNGQAADEYGRLGLAAKIRVSKTQLKLGELQPNLPTLVFSDIRLLPPTYQGVSITSTEVPGLTLQGGHLTSTSLRNEAGESRLQALLGNKLQGQVSSDAFNYAGADYTFNDERSTVSAWFSQLEDIYDQNFFGLKHSQPMGDWVLGANIGYYDAKEEGRKLVGKIDNQSFFSLLSAKHGGHTFYAGYQGMYGDSPFPRLFLNVSALGNELPTYEFVSIHERSYQLRYDYDFAALKVPGLLASARYVTGNNVTTAAGYEGKDRERDLDLSYTFQSPQ